MKKLYVILFILVMSITHMNAFTWDECIRKYDKAKQFSENTRLLYIYLKSTKSCLVKFKEQLIQEPDPEFTVKAMSNNILMLDKYINETLPTYSYSKNDIEQIPKYLNTDSAKPILNEEYSYFKKFNNCNGIHAEDKIYTAKHCNVEKSKNLRNDLNYIQTNKHSKLKISKIDMDKPSTYKYYSMSKEGMFYNVLLQEKNCKLTKVDNNQVGLNTTLDLADLEKKQIIKSTCLAIPSNSGGGVFQEGKLVGIISKTVFRENKFAYSIIEPIIPLK